MGRRAAHDSEIAGRGHQPNAEMVLPDAIHNHPGGKRIVRAGQPASQPETPAATEEDHPAAQPAAVPAAPTQHDSVVGNAKKKKGFHWPWAKKKTEQPAVELPPSDSTPPAKPASSKSKSWLPSWTKEKSTSW